MEEESSVNRRSLSGVLVRDARKERERECIRMSGFFCSSLFVGAGQRQLTQHDMLEIEVSRSQRVYLHRREGHLP